MRGKTTVMWSIFIGNTIFFNESAGESRLGEKHASMIKKKVISVFIWRNLFKEKRVTMFLCWAFY